MSETPERRRGASPGRGRRQGSFRLGPGGAGPNVREGALTDRPTAVRRCFVASLRSKGPGDLRCSAKRPSEGRCPLGPRMGRSGPITPPALLLGQRMGRSGPPGRSEDMDFHNTAVLGPGRVPRPCLAERSDKPAGPPGRVGGPEENDQASTSRTGSAQPNGLRERLPDRCTRRRARCRPAGRHPRVKTGCNALLASSVRQDRSQRTVLGAGPSSMHPSRRESAHSPPLSVTAGSEGTSEGPDRCIELGPGFPGWCVAAGPDASWTAGCALPPGLTLPGRRRVRCRRA